MASQQVMWQGRAEELPISSKQQPSSLPQTRPAGIQAGFAAVVLAALSFSLVLAYAAVSASITRNGYREMALRQEMEDLRAQAALLRYQIQMAESSGRVHETAAQLGLTPADPVREVDYVLLPYSVTGDRMQLAAADPTEESAGLTAVLAEFAAGVATSAGGRAEASTGEGHRR